MRPPRCWPATPPWARELTARLDARKGLGSVQDATALKIDNGTPVWTVPLYGGTVLNDVVVDTLPVVATVRSGAFSKPEAGEAAPVTAEAVEVPADAIKTKVVEAVKEISESVNLEEAKVIVTGGRGMGSQENFALVEELAQLLGGVVGATRPAIEEGWVSRCPPGRPVRQDCLPRPVHRLRRVRRHPARVRHDRFRLRGGHQQGRGRPHL